MSSAALGVPVAIPGPFEPGPLSPPRPPRPFPAARGLRRHLSRRARRPIALPGAPEMFPWLARRFAPGEATLWVGPPSAIEPMLELLYAGSAAARGRIALVEGANRFDPYRVGELGRSLGVDATTTLERIRLARPFTAYQTIALVERWAAEARRHPPTLFVGHGLTTALDDPEVPPEERTALLGHMARTLAALLAEVPVPLLLTLESGIAQFPGLVPDGPRLCDYLSIGPGPSGLCVRALRDGARLALVRRPSGQRGLPEFFDADEREVVPWGARPRRTARRWTSG